MSIEDYEVVIGLEIHAELSTKTKIFCNCSTEFGAEPNTHVCPVCMAMPGALPVLNEKVVEYAVKAGLATNCTISKDSKNDRKNLGWLRYITFLLSLTFVSALFIFKIDNLENIMFWSFIIGNIIYYSLGILLAFIFKDNRAFCKYICPVTVFLKPASYFSYLRVKCDHTKCIKCRKCLKNCPMNVDILDDSRKRKNGTECILCCDCIKNCPQKALNLK